MVIGRRFETTRRRFSEERPLADIVAEWGECTTSTTTQGAAECALASVFTGSSTGAGDEQWIAECVYIMDRNN